MSACTSNPAECVGTRKERITGAPDPKNISTSHVERMNLNMQMGMLRFTRLTNAFSKKLDAHIDAVSLNFVFYNLVRIHKSLKVTPTMAAGVSDLLWSIEDIVALIDARAPPSVKRGPCKTRAQ